MQRSIELIRETSRFLPALFPFELLPELTARSYSLQVGQLEPFRTARSTSQGIGSPRCRDQGGRNKSGVGCHVRRLPPSLPSQLSFVRPKLIVDLSFFLSSTDIQVRSSAYRSLTARNLYLGRRSSNIRPTHHPRWLDPLGSVYSCLLGYRRWTSRHDRPEACRSGSSLRDEPVFFAWVSSLLPLFLPHRSQSLPVSLSFIWFGATASEEHDDFRLAIQRELSFLALFLRSSRSGFSILTLLLSQSLASPSSSQSYTPTIPRREESTCCTGLPVLLSVRSISPQWTRKSRTHFVRRSADSPLFPFSASPSDGNSLRANLDRFEASTKFSLAAGDRQYSSFGLLHHLAAKLTANLHLSDTLLFCEEVLEDVIDWASGTATVYMVQGTGGCIKALAGKTVNLSPETVLDDEDFTDAIHCPSELPEVPRRAFFRSPLPWNRC